MASVAHFKLPLPVAVGSDPRANRRRHLQGSERGRSGLLPYVARHAPLGSLRSYLPTTVRSGPGMKLVYTFLFSARGFKSSPGGAGRSSLGAI